MGTHDDMFADEDSEVAHSYDRGADADSILGVRLGRPTLFVAFENMPRLHTEQITNACDNIVHGEDTYSSLVYLGRCRTDDTEALFEATKSTEIRVRWERLWVLSTYFAKLARSPEARDRIINCMAEDLVAVHLLSKFVEQKNSAVTRLFSRLRQQLLKLILERLYEYRNDAQRATLLAGILATIETDRRALEKALVEHLGKQVVEELMALLIVRHRLPGKLSSSLLREKLEQWATE